MQCHACLSHHHPSAFTPNPCQCEFSHLHALLCIAARCMRARSYVVCSCLCCAQMNGLRFSGHCTLKMRIKLSGIVPAFTIPQQLTRKRIWRGHRMCTVQTRYMHPNLLHCSLLQICISGIQRAWAMCNVCCVCVCVNRNRTHNRGYNIWAYCTTCGSGSGFHKSAVSTSESARKPTFNARPLHKMAHTVACVLFPCHGMACGCVCVCVREDCATAENSGEKCKAPVHKQQQQANLITKPLNYIKRSGWMKLKCHRPPPDTSIEARRGEGEGGAL